MFTLSPSSGTTGTVEAQIRAALDAVYKAVGEVLVADGAWCGSCCEPVARCLGLTTCPDWSVAAGVITGRQRPPVRKEWLVSPDDLGAPARQNRHERRAEAARARSRCRHVAKAKPRAKPTLAWTRP